MMTNYSEKLFSFYIFVSCSLFLGPIVGGYLNDSLDFEWAAAIIGLAGVSSVSIHCVTCPLAHICLKGCKIM